MLTRVQRSRKKGAKLPPRTVCCTRPSRWSNPFRPISKDPAALAQCLADFELYLDTELRLGRMSFEELGEYDHLACWCGLDQPCHVDIILNRLRQYRREDWSAARGQPIGAMDQAPPAVPVILKWKGSKIPRGETIAGVEVAWAQHGVLSGADGEMIGSYVRLVTFGGPNADEHEISVTSWPRHVGGADEQLPAG